MQVVQPVNAKKQWDTTSGTHHMAEFWDNDYIPDFVP